MYKNLVKNPPGILRFVSVTAYSHVYMQQTSNDNIGSLGPETISYSACDP